MALPANRRLAAAALILLARGCGQAAVLQGTVEEYASGRPLARSHVTLKALRDGLEMPLGTALSDSEGRFTFPNLAAGSYLVEAQRDGYYPGYFGQKRWNSPGAPIVLSADGQYSANVRLRRLGSVTGRVLDENQVGLPGTVVYALETARQPVMAAGSGISDDRGVYRIAGLLPGWYYIRTGPRELEDHRSLLPTSWGQAGAGGAGRLVEVALDSEAEHVDIQPVAGRLGRLAGQVTGGVAAWVALTSEFGRQQRVPGPGGSFSFEQLAPGEYELSAGTATSPVLAAYRRVTVGAGASAANLQLAALPQVHVRVEVEGGEALSGLDANVFLEGHKTAGESPFSRPPVRIPAGGSSPVMPGVYGAVVRTPPGFYVKALRPGTEVAVLGGEPVEILVTLSTRPGSISGKVAMPDGTAVAGIPVFLDTADAELRGRLGGVRSTRTGPDGRYGFGALPPGEYRIAASFDPDFASLPTQTVTLEEGKHATLDLEPAGGL